MLARRDFVTYNGGMVIQPTCRGFFQNRIRIRAAFVAKKQSSGLKQSHKCRPTKFAGRKSRRCKNDLPACIEEPYGHYQGTQQFSITALTDSTATIKERYAYSAYGQLTITDASGTARTATAEGNRITYTGREWDEDVEIYHFRARMYDPPTGRFLSRDPIGYEGSPWNQYLYVSGSPLTNADPNGTFGFPIRHGGSPGPDGLHHYYVTTAYYCESSSMIYREYCGGLLSSTSRLRCYGACTCSVKWDSRIEKVNEHLQILRNLVDKNMGEACRRTCNVRNMYFRQSVLIDEVLEDLMDLEPYNIFRGRIQCTCL